MTDFSHLQSRLAETFADGVTGLHTCRGNELHFHFDGGDILPLAGLLRDEFGARLQLMVGNDRRADKGLFEVHYLFEHCAGDWFAHVSVDLPGDNPQLESIGTFYFPAAKFERELSDTFGIQAAGLPSPTRLVRHSTWPEGFYPLRKDAARENFEGGGEPYSFLPVEGEGIYEIPVGPVHAGIIEPGHFRFSVVGETIINLQMHLFFTHKGVEKLFEGRSPAQGVELAERISGDTAAGHALAYCQALESLAGCEVPRRAKYLRVIYMEMERLYNHVADFGAICNDTGFAFAHSQCFRIRERLLRLNKALTGHRLLRGGILPGGVARDLPEGLDLAGELDAILTDFNEVVEISLGNSMLMDRLEGTGRLTRQTASDHGVLGYVARASGIDVDARRDHPHAAYASLDLAVPVYESGDVFARTMVRVDEVRQAVSLIKQCLKQLPGGLTSAGLGDLPSWQPAFGLAEGWRGTILHWVMLDGDKNLYRVKVKDPSFANWPALSFAVLKNIVPDFPLCNKSFNQSYSGNDL